MKAMEAETFPGAHAWPGIPENLWHGLECYFVHRIQPGGFLTAVLENDLHGACQRADGTSRTVLWELSAWLFNHAPGGSYGTPQRVRAWLNGEDDVD